MSGFISKPSLTRKDRYGQLFFVNRRFVRSRSIGDAVAEAYASLLERGRHPAAVIFLDIPPAEVDVNVHPAKLLVKFSEERRIRAHVYDGINHAFALLRRPSGSDSAEPQGGASSEGRNGTAVLPDVGYPAQAIFEYGGMTGPSERSGGALKLGWGDLPGASGHGGALLFQVGRCYIVRINDDSLSIIDQHAAHERIFYEHFSKAVSSGLKEVQRLLFPVRLDLTARDAEVMEMAVGAFGALGFTVENFGERSYVVQTVPAILKDADIKGVVSDALTDLSTRAGTKIDYIDEMVKIMACRASVKAGDELSQNEMNSILEQLKKCELPFTCPHGRPTVVDIGTDEMEKMFRRK